MVNIMNSYPSKYLRSADLEGRTIKVTIERVEMETVGDNMKPVVYFKGKTKGLVANKTNGMTLAAEFGPETDNWEGAVIELYSTKVPFQGQLTDSLRVRVPPPAAKPARTNGNGPVTTPARFIPNARDDARLQEQARLEQNTLRPRDETGDQIDDAIPF